jgi:glycerophosphoryl diester phosphodiesterase
LQAVLHEYVTIFHAVAWGPSPPREPDAVTLVLAHRGYTEGFAENTLDAFLAAGRLGADGVELDVRRSADGALVVHHDAALPGGAAISETRVRDLPPHVPLLAEVLGACDAMLVNVEIKNSPGDPGHDPTGALAAAVAGEIAESGRSASVVVSSFDAPTIDAVRSADPGLAVGWLLAPGSDPLDAVAPAVERGYQAIHPFVGRVGPALVAEARSAGLAVHVWTVNAPDALREMVHLGADAVITDRLTEALAIAAGP